MDIMIYIERYGFIILILLSIFELSNKQIYLFFFNIGLAINTIINLFLKIIIKEPRPSNNSKLDELVKKNNYLYDIEKYGMPSGHAQNLGFSCGFMFMFIKNSYLLYIYLIICILTLFQRYKTKKHSILQLIIGFILGFIIGYSLYKFGNHYLKGKLNHKKDDYAFIY
jgi:membrane-associated phospholipid phosphatase